MARPAALDEHLLRRLTPRVLAILVRRYGDFAAAEDAVQEALLAAALQWPMQGVPDNPRAWLIRVGARRLTDQLRAEIARRRRETELAESTPADELFAPAPEYDEDTGQADDSLTLLFMCCHPALTPASSIALTLRAVGGLSTAEIANAFLVPEATMAQRISRAKQTIRSSGIAFATPDDRERAARLASVLHVLYLIFNEGYVSSGADLQRMDLANEAIRLTRIVHTLRPAHGEATGLLALMLLTHARHPARTGTDGELIALTQQDRRRWLRPLIDEGVALLDAALAHGTVGEYQLQAAVAALHDEAPDAAGTDWPQILALYELMRRMRDNPMIELNCAIAAAMVHGPTVGLQRLQALAADRRLAGNHRLDATRAHLHEMAGSDALAIEHYLAAAALTPSIQERNYLAARAARLEAAQGVRSGA